MKRLEFWVKWQNWNFVISSGFCYSCSCCRLLCSFAIAFRQSYSHILHSVCRHFQLLLCLVSRFSQFFHFVMSKCFWFQFHNYSIFVPKFFVFEIILRQFLYKLDNIFEVYWFLVSYDLLSCLGKFFESRIIFF